MIKVDEIKPIFIIGMNRSGTKWLSNLLCNHSQISCIQSVKAKGILETNIFVQMQNKFDIALLDDYIGFIQVWSETNFFKRTHFRKEILYNLKPRPTKLVKVFEIVMDNYAKTNGTNFWLQKTTPEIAQELVTFFNDAYFIIIKRDIVDTLRSQFQRANRKKTIYQLIRHIYIYVLDEKRIKKLNRIKNCININYHDLNSDVSKELRNICNYLNIEFNPNLLNVHYERNSSFTNEKQRKKIISPKDEIKIKFLYKIFSLIPFLILYYLKSIGYKRHILTKGEKFPFIPDTFSDIKIKYKLK